MLWGFYEHKNVLHITKSIFYDKEIVKNHVLFPLGSGKQFFSIEDDESGDSIVHDHFEIFCPFILSSYVHKTARSAHQTVWFSYGTLFFIWTHPFLKSSFEISNWNLKKIFEYHTRAIVLKMDRNNLFSKKKCKEEILGHQIKTQPDLLFASPPALLCPPLFRLLITNWRASSKTFFSPVREGKECQLNSEKMILSKMKSTSTGQSRTL